MARFVGRAFRGERVLVENNEYINCYFEDCQMVFSGAVEGPSAMTGNRFGPGIAWTFEGPARKTIEYLHALYHGLGGAGKAQVEQIFEAIRRPG